jgi:MoaA/NifB/PqqE/SkfB family radical SAM enzyme
MCPDWTRHVDVKNELSVNEIGEVYRNPLFSSLKRFGLSGGEPTLREDLVEIARVVLECRPSISEMVLTTNGLEPNLVIERVGRLLELGERERLSKFTVVVSVDGYGDTHEKIRRVPLAFERVSETLKRLKELQLKKPFALYSTCVVQPSNIDNLVQLAKFGCELGLPISYIPVRIIDSRMGDVSQRDLSALPDEQLRKLRAVFEDELQHYLRPSGVLLWREYFKIVGGGKRRLPCYLLYYFAEVDSDGTLRVCVQRNSLDYGNVRVESPDRIWYSEKAREIRRKARELLCPSCDACCDVSSALAQEFFCYASFLLAERARKLLRN